MNTLSICCMSATDSYEDMLDSKNILVAFAISNILKLRIICPFLLKPFEGKNIFSKIIITIYFSLKALCKKALHKGWAYVTKGTRKHTKMQNQHSNNKRQY